MRKGPHAGLPSRQGASSLLEAQFGNSRREGLREAMPEYYAQAVIEHDVDVVAHRRSSPAARAAPCSSTPSSRGPSVELRLRRAAGRDPEPRRQRRRSTSRSTTCATAELSAVERAAADEDHVTIDIEATHGDEPVPDLHHGLRLPPRFGRRRGEIDENLRGASAGDEIEFSADHPDPEEPPVLDHRQGVKEAVLPDLDDSSPRPTPSSRRLRTFAPTLPIA